MPGWNCMVRLYRPRPEILIGSELIGHDGGRSDALLLQEFSN